MLMREGSLHRVTRSRRRSLLNVPVEDLQPVAGSHRFLPPEITGSGLIPLVQDPG